MQEIKLSIIQKHLESNLFDYNDTYILAKGEIAIIGKEATQVAFKNCTLFI